MASRLSSTAARSARADASISERMAFAERMSSAYERGEIISIDIAQDPHNLAMFTRYAEQYGGTSAAARALMEAELARQSLRPTHVFSDGTAVPASFGGIREKYEQARNDGTFADDLGEVRQANDARVTRHRTGVPAAQPQELGPSLIRSDIQSARERVQGQTAGAAGTFDSKAQTSIHMARSSREVTLRADGQADSRRCGRDTGRSQGRGEERVEARQVVKEVAGFSAIGSPSHPAAAGLGERAVRLGQQPIKRDSQRPSASVAGYPTSQR